MKVFQRSYCVYFDETTSQGSTSTNHVAFTVLCSRLAIVPLLQAQRSARGAFQSAAPVLDGEQCVLNTSCSSCQTPSSKFLELFAQFQVLQALGSSSNPPKVPPAAPRIPPGLPKWVRLFHFGRPSAELSSFFVDFGTPQKSAGPACEMSKNRCVCFSRAFSRPFKLGWFL